ncbi:MAG: hypothetical protein HC888_19490 [Candidatus Competibacteraceae bacterium]|nr:hypothetical protein [Candidatus Competibacteraceae bacterium]
MNVKAAQVIADGMLKGAFDVFDAMLSLSCKFDPQPAEAADETRLAEALIQCPVVLQGRIQNNLGAVALLFSTRAALQLSALVQESDAEAQDELSPQDKAVLRDVAEPALGGGVTNLMERFGRNVEQLDGIEVLGRGGDRTPWTSLFCSMKRRCWCRSPTTGARAGAARHSRCTASRWRSWCRARC